MGAKDAAPAAPRQMSHAAVVAADAACEQRGRSTAASERRALVRLLTLPGLQPRLQPPDEANIWGISNLTGEGAMELRAHIVATALDKELLPHVGEERPAQWVEVEALARQRGVPRMARAELLRMAAAHGIDEVTVDDALWYWHEVGLLIYYRTVPQLRAEIFVDTNWLLKLVNGLVEQAHKKTFDAPALSRMIKTGVLQHSLLARLWSGVMPPVTADAEQTLLALMSQFDLLLPGPEPDSSFVPLLLPTTVADTPRAAQRVVTKHWPVSPGAAEAQAGVRFLFLNHSLPPGLVARLLVRCAAVAGCRAVHCWRGGMLARVDTASRCHAGGSGGSGRSAGCAVPYAHAPTPRWLCVQSGRRPDPDTGQPVAFVDVMLRATVAQGGAQSQQVACHAVAPFVAAMRELLRDRYAGLVAEQKLLCPHCVRAAASLDMGEFFMFDCDGGGSDGMLERAALEENRECDVCFRAVCVAQLVPRGVPQVKEPPAPMAAAATSVDIVTATDAADADAAAAAAELPASKRRRVGQPSLIAGAEGCGLVGDVTGDMAGSGDRGACYASAAKSASGFAEEAALSRPALLRSSSSTAAASTVASAKRCVVQLGVYDRASRRLLNLSSGALLAGGRVLTAAHNVLDMRCVPPAPLVLPLPSRVAGGGRSAVDRRGLSH